MTTFCFVLVKRHFVACNPSWTALPMVVICIEKGLLAEGLWCYLKRQEVVNPNSLEEPQRNDSHLVLELQLIWRVSHFCSCDKIHTNRLEQGPAIVAHYSGHSSWRWENRGSRDSRPAAHTAFGVQKWKRDGCWCLAHSVLRIQFRIPQNGDIHSQGGPSPPVSPM